MNLPVHQVRKGQGRPAALCIQPDAEVMQGDLGGQARLKPAEFMRTLPVEAEGMRELLIHRLHDLPHPSHPAPEPLSPTTPLYLALCLSSLAMAKIGPVITLLHPC